jgi:hypothetical protein
MDELDEYGAFNARYEGIGQLWYSGSPPIPTYFEARQLADGRLLVGCVSIGEPIREKPVAIGGHLLTGQQFDTMWGRGITEIYRSGETVSKAHYLANMTRVRYTPDLEPRHHSAQFALHNFIPGTNSGLSGSSFEFTIHDHAFTLIPVGNYELQASQLKRYGGNLRTSWIKTESGFDSHEVVNGLINAISLAVGTLVTSPQMITFDKQGNRNDVEHYSSDAKPLAQFIPAQGWDTPIKETIDAWFSGTKPLPFGPQELAVWIRQHLDACADEIYLETRALASATLLDVIAGRYCVVWAPQTPPKDIAFRRKLKRLLRDIGIVLTEAQLTSIVSGRNSLVHSGKFVTSQNDSEYRNLIRLGRSILLRLIGFPSKLHEEIEV